MDNKKQQQKTPASPSQSKQQPLKNQPQQNGKSSPAQQKKPGSNW